MIVPLLVAAAASEVDRVSSFHCSPSHVQVRMFAGLLPPGKSYVTRKSPMLRLIGHEVAGVP